MTAAIRIAAAGLGVAVAGPLGGALGSVVAGAFGEHAANLIGAYAKKFGEEAGKKFLDTGADSLIGRLKPSAPSLESACREALRLSLSQIRAQSFPSSPDGFDDWFRNWETCLIASIPLQLDDIQPGQLAPASADGLFLCTMERLDAQGQAIKQRSLSIDLTTRPIPVSLATELNNGLPKYSPKNFREIIVHPDYSRAWKQVELIFRDSLTAALGRIDDTTADTNRMVRALYDAACREGRIPERDPKAKDEEIARLTAELTKFKAELATRSETGDAEISRFLAAGDFDAALQIKSRQVEMRRQEADKLPRDLYELGTIYELRFEWPQALAAYRQAWELGKNPNYGFQYAYSAQKLNRFSEAIAVYEALLEIYANHADRAHTLNNLANLFSDTQRMREAEEAFVEALSIYRKLAETNPGAYLTDVAMTLNNLANLFSATQRIREAEEAFGEALATNRKLAETDPGAYLTDVAMTLNNLAILYRGTQRMREAEEAYGEALTIYRKLAEGNTDAYLPDVAAMLNNLAVLYSNTQRMREAEEAYEEALAIRRKLSETNPDAYLTYVATTLNNLASLYRSTQRMREAEEAFGDALTTCRKLAEADPDAYLCYVPITLNNLANLYGSTQRMREAEEAYEEALAIRRKLAEANPDAYLPDVAMTLNNLAILYCDTQRVREAEEANEEALAAYRKLAEANPHAYLPDLAMTLNNLAILYCDTQRVREAEEAYEEALAIRRKLAEANPHAYLPDVALTLSNLAILYRGTQRMRESKDTYEEVLAAYRKLAGANSDAYLPDVAMTLNDIALLNFAMEQIYEAGARASEAEDILDPLWRQNPAVHGDSMARVLLTGAFVAEANGRSASASCALAQRALEASYDPVLQRTIRELIDRLCPKDIQ